jgi:hypothetical protein
MFLSIISIVLFFDMSNGYSLRILLDDDIPSPHIINLEEIMLFSGGEKLPVNSLDISFTGGKSLFPASLCNDENAEGFCHSAIEYNDGLGHFLQDNDETSLVINSHSKDFDKIIVVNRVGFEERIVGAKIFVYDSVGTTLWTSVFQEAKQIYVFSVSTGK